MRLYEVTATIQACLCDIFIKLLYTYFISNKYLYLVYIISLKVILYISQGIKLFN